jgi:hypothetical protein
MSNCVLKESALKVHSERGLIKGGEILDTELVASGEVNASNLAFKGGRLTFARLPGTETRASLSHCTFENVSLGYGHERIEGIRVEQKECKFDNCRIIGIEVGIGDVDSWARACSDCTGALLVSDKPEHLPRRWQESGLKGSGLHKLGDSLIVVLCSLERDVSVLVDGLGSKLTSSELSTIKALAESVQRAVSAKGATRS